MIIAVNIVKAGQWDDAIYKENRLCGGQEISDVIHPVTGEKVRGLRPNYMSSLPMVLSHTEDRGKFTYAIFDLFKEVWEEKFVFPKMKANMWELKEKGLNIHAVLTTRVGNSRPFLDHEWEEKMPNKKIEVRWCGDRFVGHIPGPNNIKFYIGEKFDWRTDDQKILDFAKEHFGVNGEVRKPFTPQL